MCHPVTVLVWLTTNSLRSLHWTSRQEQIEEEAPETIKKARLVQVAHFEHVMSNVGLFSTPQVNKEMHALSNGRENRLKVIL